VASVGILLGNKGQQSNENNSPESEKQTLSIINGQKQSIPNLKKKSQ